MATGTAGDQARLQARQVVNTWRKQINWNDPSNGVNVPGVVLPMGAFILNVLAEIVVIFDGTPSLVVGTNASANDIIAAGDLNEAATGVTAVTRGLGRSLTAAADTTVYTRLTSTGATAGQAEIVITYEGNTG